MEQNESFDIEFAGTCDLAMWCNLLREKGWTGPRIARALNRSEGYVNNLIRIIQRASPAVIVRWREEQAGSVTAVCATDWLVQLCLLPHDQQDVELQRRIESNSARTYPRGTALRSDTDISTMSKGETMSYKAFIIGTLAILLLFGCAAEAENTQDLDSRAFELSLASGTEEGAEPDVSTPGQSALVAPAAGCSFVEWCDAPGPRKAVCRQQGCDSLTAMNECKSEVRRFCGPSFCTCPEGVALIHQDGGIGTVCPC